MDGLLFLDKEVGLTSRAVDNRIQKKFQEKKVGHLGTLDPFASGLLILALGKATKCLPYLPDEEKSYLAEIKLGYQSDTGDCTGVISGDGSYTKLDIDSIHKALKSLLGKQMQIPPMTSAIKVAGKPLYELAHQGKVIERQPREIEVYSAELVSYQEDVLTVSFTVSKGTYIRTLGEELAKRLGTIGYLQNLRRIAVGNLSVEQAKKLDDLTEEDLKDPTSIIPLRKIEITEAQAKKAMNGVPLLLEEEEEKILLLQKGKAIAVYRRKENGVYEAERGLF
ncbi:MAG: tRNA pseudouridine(55) synthase TruB [Bacilli bacterium]|nr:tRNA pseudouridine(55) synthase TruB [Bacilli bacterium]